MSQWDTLSPPKVDSLVIDVLPPRGVRFAGTITLQEPSRILGGFLKAVHEAAIADHLSSVELDVTALKFVNSSAIRLFLDWVGWLKADRAPAYELIIRTTRKFTWQKTSFVAITALAPECVKLVPSD